MKYVNISIICSIAILILATCSLGYALINQDSLPDRVEKINKSAYFECIERIDKNKKLAEIRKATNACGELEKIEIKMPKNNTGTLTAGSTAVPERLTIHNNEKTNGNKIGYGSGGLNTALISMQQKAIATSNQVNGKTDMTIQSTNSGVPIGSGYWTAYDTAIGLIHKYEGLRLKAYHDYKGCSIGWGTRAKSCKEKITKEEADTRLVYIVKSLVATIQKDFPKLHPEGQGALVSFAFNCHQGYQSVKNNGLSYHSKWCKTAGGKVLKGLVERRNEESIFIFSKK